MAHTTEHKLEELYLSNLELIGEGFPAAINRGRQRPIERLRLEPLPGARDERYHLTDIRSLYGQDWEYYFVPTAAGDVPVCGGVLDDGPAYRIGMADGFTDGSLAEEDNGLIYGSLRSASTAHEALVAGYYNRAAGANGDVEPLAGLNNAFMQDGVFIHVPEGVALDRPVVIDCRYIPREEAAACFTRILMVFGAGSSAEVVILHRSGQGAGLLANAVCEVFAAGDARVRITEFACMNPASTLLHGSFIVQQARSSVALVAVASGGEGMRMAYQADLAGTEADLDLKALYLATEQERKDFNVRVNHLVPGCKSRELVKGIASGQAVGSFTGCVYVARDAQRTEALQQSRNIELGGQARIFTRPQLEIYADDVRCSHGATVGHLDDQAVYYMRQRGIDERTARRLQLEGFVKDVTLHAGYGRDFLDELIRGKVENL